jgi:hypothetical protein
MESFDNRMCAWYVASVKKFDPGEAKPIQKLGRDMLFKTRVRSVIGSNKRWFIVAVTLPVFLLGALVLASNNQIIFENDFLVSNGPTNHRWEPTSAVTSYTWATGWRDIDSGISYVSTYNPQAYRWNQPVNVTPSSEIGLGDLNLVADTFQDRFVYVALGSYAPAQQVYYGFSTDRTGSNWVVNPQPIFSSVGGCQSGETVSWDYPSVAVDAGGHVVVGAIQMCQVAGQQKTINGYWTATASTSAVGSGSNLSQPTFSTPVQLPTISMPGGGVQNGEGARVVGTSNNVFEAFVPSMDEAGNPAPYLPNNIARYESTDGGITWTQPATGIGLGGIFGGGPFGEPKNNTPPDSTGNAIFYAPTQLMATGYKNGLWALVFDADYYGFSELIVCTSDRGCGWVNAVDSQTNPYANDQFLAGISVSSDGGYWIFYYTFQLPRTLPNLITQAIYIAPGANPIGATVNDYVLSSQWTSGQKSCVSGITTCYEAGDFQQIASIGQLTASTPWIHKLNPNDGLNGNDLIQNFISDPAASTTLKSFTPNFIPIKAGTNLIAVSRPVPPQCFGLPPGHD